MNCNQAEIVSSEIGILKKMPVYGNRKQVIANVDQCLVFRDQAKKIIKMLLALDQKGSYRYLLIEDPRKIEQLRKGARKLKDDDLHPAFAALKA